MLKDKMVFDQDFNDINLRCQGCQLKNHLSKNCPITHFNPDREYLIKKHVYPSV